MAWYSGQFKGTLPSPRIGHTFIHVPASASNINEGPPPAQSPGNCVLFGGYDGTNCLNDVQILSVDSLEWTSIPCGGDVPEARTGHCCAHVGGGKIIIFGGRNKTKVFGDAYVLDLPSATWNRVPNLGGRDNDISPSRPRVPSYPNSATQGSGDTCTLPGPSALAEQACVVQNGRIMVWGGAGLNNIPNEVVMSYDPREGIWTHLMPPETATASSKYLPEPPGRIGHTLVARPDVATLLLIGGTSDVLQEEWRKHKAMQASGGGSASSSGDSTWSLCKESTSKKPIVWKDQEDTPLRVYDCRMTKWFPPLVDVAGAAQLNQRSARMNHIAALTPTGIVVQGGLDYDGQILDDWFLIHPWSLRGLRRPTADVEDTPGARFGHACAVALARGALVFGGGDLVNDDRESLIGGGGKMSLRPHADLNVMAW